MTELPHVDEHDILVAAPPEAVWRSVESFGGAGRSASRAYARLIGCDPPSGFGVVESDPPSMLRLAGRHRFSRYELVFRLAPGPHGTVLGAETRAVFPGPHGAAYRLLVISSGLHARAVRRFLLGIASRST